MRNRSGPAEDRLMKIRNLNLGLYAKRHTTMMTICRTSSPMIIKIKLGIT